MHQHGDQRTTLVAPRDERRWALLRFGLGMMQMASAVVAVTLLFTTGMNPWSLAAVVITCALTTVSVLLFREWPHQELWRRS